MWTRRKLLGLVIVSPLAALLGKQALADTPKPLTATQALAQWNELLEPGLADLMRQKYSLGTTMTGRFSCRHILTEEQSED